MKRQDKYPDTPTFHYYNANPKNRITGDCVFRAIARATGKPYEQVVRDMAEVHIRTGYSPDMQGIDKLMAQYGWRKCKQPRHDNGKKYTGDEFCRLQKTLCHNGSTRGKTYGTVTISDRIVASIGTHHVVAIVDGYVNDIWNSTTGCIGVYWVPNDFA